ncbi:hypothetical protein Zmor_014678 [Zophobas morio]|uniref:Reverse transcriptase domain-containing protein n=2 Tax=Zophobas morio TaxID=2755281 RepID=A0AA38MH23_9CUCU|nr:hypothetical protein Zmor_014678 [Zophobas morio]
MRNCRNNVKRLHVGYREMLPVYISECAFADDIVIFAGSERDLQRNLSIWDEELTKKKMKINVEKTKVMAIGKQTKQINISINGRKLEQVKHFNYLGVTIDDTGRQEADNTERIEKCNKLYYAINNTFINKREISQKTKMSVYKTIYLPTLTYGCETWVLSQKMKSRLEANEMKYLRRVIGVTLRDHIRSSQIREQLQSKKLMDAIENKQLSWWGHVQRMNADRAAKQVWQAKVQGRRSRGRPQETWNNTIQKSLRKRGKTWIEAKEMARNKKEWGKFVHGEEWNT